MPETLAIVNASRNPIAAFATPATPIAGQSMLAYTLAAVTAAKQVDRLIVLTTDANHVVRGITDEVVTVAEELDQEGAVLYALDHLATNEGYHPDLVMALGWTAPLLTAEDLDKIIELMITEKSDSALAVSKVAGPLWSATNSVGHPLTEQHSKFDAQYFIDTGYVNVMRAAGFRETAGFPYGKTVLYQLPTDHAPQVRTAIDLEVTAIYLHRQKTRQQDALLPREIRAIVFDFDGVFTDNLVMVDQEGREAALCSRGDGMGIGELKKTGIPILVLSKEPVPIVVRRCEKLGLDCLHGIDNKLPLLDRWLEEREITRETTIYMGNDINDYECLDAMGCGVVPADAHPDVLPVANVILDYPGGQGAVRQLCDLVCRRAKPSDA